MPHFPEIPQKYRAYLYRVVVAAFAVAILKGWVHADDVEAWLGLAAAVLATANTSTSEG